jgi:hypothetical protein
MSPSWYMYTHLLPAQPTGKQKKIAHTAATLAGIDAHRASQPARKRSASNQYVNVLL